MMRPETRRALADGALILLSVWLLVLVGGAAWSCYDRLGWVRFVTGHVRAGWLRAVLLGWF